MFVVDYTRLSQNRLFIEICGIFCRCSLSSNFDETFGEMLELNTYLVYGRFNLGLRLRCGTQVVSNSPTNNKYLGQLTLFNFTTSKSIVYIIIVS